MTSIDEFRTPWAAPAGQLEFRRHSTLETLITVNYQHPKLLKDEIYCK